MKTLLGIIFGILTLAGFIAMYGGFLGIPVAIIGFIVSLFTSLSVPWWAPFASLGVGIGGLALSVVSEGIATATLGE